MELWEKIVAEYPELADNDFAELGDKGSIKLRDDSDGIGAYILKWEYAKPIPTGLKLGKPKA
jgi:hypothetical protein